MQTTKRKQVIVVKSLKDLSPKKQILVARAAGTEDQTYLQGTGVGNASPMKPEKKDGEYVSRSILGQPSTFEVLDKRRGVTSAGQAKGSRGRKTRTIAAPVERAVVDADNAPPSVKVLRNPSLYVSMLQAQSDKAESIRARDLKRETLLMAYLPINDKFNMNKEGEVLTRWQERQKEWAVIQAKVAKQLDAPKHHSLMMTKTHDYRIKREEYDLIQAAIPSELKFGGSVWERSLRGVGSRIVTVGHVFTGLECEVEGAKSFPVPAIIRKPRQELNPHHKSKPFDLTASMVSIKKTLKGQLQSLRPHELEQQHADELLVRSTNLFQWAMSSAKQYFSDRGGDWQDDYEYSVGDASHTSYVEASSEDPAAVVPRLSLVSSNEVVFAAVTGQMVSQEVVFENTGTVTAEYVWRPEWHRDSLERAHRDGAEFGSVVSQIIDGKEDAPRESTLARNKSNCFFCSRPRGSILPGQQVRVRFIFNSAGVVGERLQCWQLSTVPRAKYTMRNPKINADGDDGAVSINELRLRLHGVTHSLEMDETASSRDEVDRFITSKTLSSMAEDEIFNCLRRVRDPVRISTIQDREIEVFKKVNESLLVRLSDFTSSLPLFVTPDRLGALRDLCFRSIDFNVDVEQRVQYLRLKHLILSDPMMSGEDESSLDTVRIQECAGRHSQPAKLQEIKSFLFPENKIEIFDEITESDICPSWDLDVQLLEDSLLDSLTLTLEIQSLEKTIAGIEKANAKVREKEAKHQAWLAARNPDDDEEEEEEEEEEEDEEDAVDVAAVREVHALTRLGDELLSECRGRVKELVVRPCRRDELHRLAADILASVIENIVDWTDAARAEVGIDAGVPLPEHPFSSPFTSEAGAHAWKNLLAPEQEVDPKGGKGKAKPKAAAPPKKGKDKGSGAAPTAEQVAEYHLKAHELVKAGLLHAAEAMFCKLDELYENRMMHNRLQQAQLLGADVLSASLLCKDDASASESVAFVCFDGASFTTQPVASAFKFVDFARKTALEPVVSAAQYGAKAVVLVYESQTATVSSENYVSEAVPIIDTILKARETDERAQQQVKMKKKSYDKTKAHVDIDFVVVPCLNLAELLHRLEAYRVTSHSARQPATARVAPTASASTSSTAREVLVFVLDDLAHESIVPPVPALPALVYSDAAAPVDLGAEEYETFRAEAWRKRAHRVPVSVSSSGSKPAVVQCLTDVTSAFDEALQCVRERLLWVEGNTSAVFLHKTSCLQRSVLHQMRDRSRCVSTLLHENLLWVEVLNRTRTYAGSTPGASAVPALAAVRQAACSGEIVVTVKSCRDLQSGGDGASRPVNSVVELRLRGSEQAPLTTSLKLRSRNPNFGESFTLNTYEGEPVLLDLNVWDVSNPLGNELLGSATVDASQLILREDFDFNMPLGRSNGSVQFKVLRSSLSSSENGNRVNMKSLFPRCTSSPKVCFVLGGELRLDKFRVLDEVLDLAHTVVVCGEMCIPFLALSGRVRFPCYEAVCGEYAIVSRRALQKARLRGVRLVLPADVMCTDEAITAELKRKVFDRFDPLSRDDAADFDGEVKAVTVALSDDSPADVERALLGPLHGAPASVPAEVIVAGFVYDIGEASRKVLEREVAGSDLLLAWGTVGVCEVSGFQMGQRSLIQAAALPPLPEGSVGHAAAAFQGRPQHTWLLGEACVEWFARVIDPDGELNGDLVQAYRVSHVSRDSRLVCGLLGKYHSSYLQAVTRRTGGQPPGADWTLNHYQPEAAEEEDDEDE